MDQKDRQKIDKNSNRLKQLINFDSLVPFLLHKKIFNKPMIEDILECPTVDQRKERLLIDLCRRGPEAFQRFVNALVETGHMEAAQLLQSSVSLQRSGSLPHNSRSLSPMSRSNDNRIKVIPAMNYANFDNCYRMENNPRGCCLIINNVKFDNDILEERLGSDADAQRLDQVFQELGFEVFLRTNKTSADILDLCERIKNRIDNYLKNNSRTMDAFVMIILSHGIENGVYGTDCILIDIFTIIEKFNNQNCNGLRGSPKMFFIQACRGMKKDFGVKTEGFDVIIGKDSQLSDYKIESLSTSDANKFVGNLEIKSNKPESITILDTKSMKTASWQDIIISFPTVSGYVAFRNPEMGSWYCTALVTALTEHARNLRLIDILSVAENEIRSYQSSDGDKQSTSLTLIGWNKKLYFNPGLYKK